jgi:hypothetical protein
MADRISLSRGWYARNLKLLDEFRYLPLDNEKVYIEIFERALILKKNKI